MEQKYSKKQLEELYCCEIFKDNGFDDSHTYWVAVGKKIDEDKKSLFGYADGWNLDELHENIREAVYNDSLFEEDKEG